MENSFYKIIWFFEKENRIFTIPSFFGYLEFKKLWKWHYLYRIEHKIQTNKITTLLKEPESFDRLFHWQRNLNKKFYQGSNSLFRVSLHSEYKNNIFRDKLRPELQVLIVQYWPFRQKRTYNDSWSWKSWLKDVWTEFLYVWTIKIICS